MTIERLHAPVRELRKVVDIISEEGPARGLHIRDYSPLSQTKGHMDVQGQHHTARPAGQRMPRIREAGFVLPDTPIGSPEFVEEKIGTSMEKVKQINDKLPLLQDAQT